VKQIETICPRRTRKARNKSVDCFEAAISLFDNDLQRSNSLHILQTSFSQRNACKSNFVPFVFFVNKVLLLE